jgi:hypothetical protein
MDLKCRYGEVYPTDKDQLSLLVFLKKGPLDNDTVYKPISEACEIILL